MICITKQILGLRLAALFALVLLAGAPAALAQRASVVVATQVPATNVISNFEKATATGKAVTPKELKYPEQFTPARVDSVLNGLERVALTSRSGFQVSSAVSAIMEAGTSAHAPLGIVDRAIRLYQASTNPTVRGTVLSLMFEQKDRPRALSFLVNVAQQSGSQRDYEFAPLHAAEALGDMGTQGRAALTELQNKKLIKDGRAAGFTHWFLTTKPK